MSMVPLIPKTQPDLSSARVWIGAGRFDPIIPASETQQLVQILQTAGADVSIRFFRAGHELTSEDIDAAHQWLMALP